MSNSSNGGWCFTRHSDSSRGWLRLMTVRRHSNGGQEPEVSIWKAEVRPAAAGSAGNKRVDHNLAPSTFGVEFWYNFQYTHCFLTEEIYQVNKCSNRKTKTHNVRVGPLNFFLTTVLLVCYCFKVCRYNLYW